MKLSEKRLAAYRGKSTGGDDQVPRQPPPPAASGSKETETGTVAPPAQGFVKTVNRREKVIKTAKFLILAGKEESREILRHLPEKMVEEVLREVAGTGPINPVEAEAILKEFHAARGDQTGGLSGQRAGGIDTARELLVQALGEEKGKAVMARVLPETAEKPFAYLEDYPAAAVLKILKAESIPALSMILPWIKPSLGAALIKSFPPEEQKKIVRRVAVRRKLETEVLGEIDARIKERITAIGKSSEDDARDGREVLARILRYLPPEEEKRIIGSLEAEDSSLGQAVRDRMFTADTVLLVRDRDLQKLLEDYSERDLALLLRNKKLEFREKLTNNISLRRRTLVEEEDLLIGSVRKSEVDAATKAFLDRIREQEEEGQLVIFRPEDEDLLE